MPLQELQALTEQQMNQMLDVSVQVDMNQAVIPPPLAMRLPGLAAQGLVVQQGDRWSSVLNASGDEVVLNGESIPVAMLKQRLEAASGLAGAAGEDAQTVPQDGELPAESGSEVP